MATYSRTVTISCPACQGSDIVKHGHKSGRQRFKCKACNRTFTNSGATKRMRFTPDQIGAAIRMYYTGMPYRGITLNLAEQEEIPAPSKKTIYYWVKRYTDKAIKDMKSHKARTGDEWVADEMRVKVGGVWYWNWNVMDSDTRYILASHLSFRRDANAARAVMKKALANAVKPPKTIKTDRLRSYIQPIKSVFPQARHIQSDGLAAEINNNRSERLQGSFRQRTKVMRGLDSKETGQRYLDGWVINYNLFTPHDALKGKTPAKAAKVNPDWSSWEDVVRPGPSHIINAETIRHRRPIRRQAVSTAKIVR